MHGPTGSEWPYGLAIFVGILLLALIIIWSLPVVYYLGAATVGKWTAAWYAYWGFY